MLYEKIKIFLQLKRDEVWCCLTECWMAPAFAVCCCLTGFGVIKLTSEPIGLPFFIEIIRCFCIGFIIIVSLLIFLVIPAYFLVKWLQANWKLAGEILDERNKMEV